MSTPKSAHPPKPLTTEEHSEFTADGCPHLMTRSSLLPLNAEIALGYLELGYRPIPLLQNKDGQWVPSVRWKPFQHRAPTRQEVAEWWMRCPNAGIALVCGREAGLEVLDVDPRHGGIDPQLSAVACSTPRGGLHYHFTRPDAIPSLESAGLEWLGDGHIARVPPTPGYKWLNRGLPKLRQDSAQWVLPEFLSPKRPSRPQRSLHQHKTCDRDLKRSLGDCVGGLRQRPEQIGASLDTKAQREFQRLLEQLGVQFDRGCHRQVVICPWHDDHDPSLSLDLERCLFKCFSPRCGVHGGIGTLRKLAGETPPFVGSISSCGQKGVSEQDRLISALRDAGEDDAAAAVNSCHREFRVYRCQACGKTPAYPVSWGFPLCPCASEPGLVSWSAPDVAR